MDPPDRKMEQTLDRLRPILVTLAEALVSPAFAGHIEASDLVQQTLLEAHHHADVLQDLEEGPFFGWLRKALQNNVLDAVRHLKTQKNNLSLHVREADLQESFARLENILVADATSASQVLQRNEQIAVMLSALQTLPRNQRMALIMKHLRGASIKEVAHGLGVTESAAAGLLHRGRQQLLHCLKEHKNERGGL